MADMHFYEPADGHGLAHDPLNAIVAPRPIGWVSTLSADGVRNLAPYSFFNLFNYRPPIIGFCSVGWKHSVANAKDTGEFVWNLATRDVAEAMNTTSTTEQVDEFAFSGLEQAASRLVKPGRVAASHVQFECRTSQVVQLADASGGAIESWLVLGEVVGIHIDRDLIVDGVYDTAKARPIMRGGGRGDYFEPGEKFEMFRPR
ncbi:flavin reductase family protein [Stakelama sp. CBK3Z-3]|uniref:Flavin reductase family protein n=1 Tax=Stakelama flava TaxID=2860338 RepID=A0ABS6XPC1_9SPHN|nr:flavin reductase family protein [Stakelama flava]MBW4331261.1 flavin reductase family protein [Stakelama flava]